MKRNFLRVLFCLILAASYPAAVSAQDGPEVPVPDTGTGNQNTGGQTQQSTPPDPTAFDPGAELEVEPAVNERHQGFVGFTSDGYIEDAFLFIGSSTEGVFGGANSFSSGGGGRGGGGGGGRGGQAGGQNGFVITRTNSIRARIVPQFRSLALPGSFVSTRFSNRVAKLPATKTMARNVKVSINNKTATITGAVASKDDSTRIERQLRMEPGVYKIVNQLRVVK